MKASLIRKTSVWTTEQIEAFLRETVIPVRLASMTGSGTPLICSLWYMFDDDAIWCATQVGSKVAVLLDKEPRCGFEIAGDLMPYQGIRGQGRATLIRERGAEVLQSLTIRYLESDDTNFAKWLRARSDSEVAIRIEPAWLTSWDFTARMTA